MHPVPLGSLVAGARSRLFDASCSFLASAQSYPRRADKDLALFLLLWPPSVLPRGEGCHAYTCFKGVREAILDYIEGLFGYGWNSKKCVG
jgi:hypothetical protein